MECKNNTEMQREECEKPRIKQEPLNPEEIVTESQTPYVHHEKVFVKCVQSYDVDTKVGILQQTWDTNSASTYNTSDCKQPLTYQGISEIKGGDELHIKEQDIQEKPSRESQRQQNETYLVEDIVNSDVKTIVLKTEVAWDPIGVSSDIKSDAEQPTNLDQLPFLGSGTIKVSNETDIKDEVWCCEETSSTFINEREGSSLMRNTASEDVPLFESSRPYTDVLSSSATQMQEIKTTVSFPAKTSTSVQNCEAEHVCNTCTKVFKLLSQLKQHNLVSKECKWRNCEKNITYSGGLKDPLIHNNTRQHMCATCGKTFSKVGNFKAHLLMHDNIRGYTCKICEKSFTQEGILKRHLVVHDDKRPYQCQICEKSFKRLGSLKKHLLLHDDKRQFQCQVCRKSFKQLWNLKEHLLIHDNKRQYKCQICEKSFKRLPDLKSHLLVHDDKKSHKCHICEKCFKRLSDLKKHLFVHGDKRQYKCQVCEKSFKQLGNLKHHLVVHDNQSNKNVK